MIRSVFNTLTIAVLLSWSVIGMPTIYIFYAMGEGGFNEMGLAYIFDYISQAGIDETVFWWLFFWAIALFPAIFLVWRISIVMRSLDKR